MNIFSWLYYSFSSHVANYERQQPWLQAVVKARLYPLFGILNFVDRAHFAASGSSEARALAPGAVASAMMIIDAVFYYLQPDTACKRLKKKFGTICKLPILILFIAMVPALVDMLTRSTQLRMSSTSLLVILFAIIIPATAAVRLAGGAYSKFASRRDY
jgi:hypothetical protein